MPNINNIHITPDMLKKISEIDSFKTTWNGGLVRLRPEQLKSMRRIATIESVGSSNRIEGNQMSDTQIETLLRNINKTSFKSRDEEEAAGYADLINTIFDDYATIPFTENYIKQLHKILLRYSGKVLRHRGEYKKDSNRVAAFDANGDEIGSIFETATPFDTPRLMAELVDRTRRNLADRYLHPIIVIGVFIVHFLAIHPFTDGNGRMSRALTVLLMLQHGYSYMPYASMESIIEASKSSYYLALRGTQKGIWADNVDYEPWLTFFVNSLFKQKQHLESKIAAAMAANDAKLSATATAILDLFETQARWTAADIARTLDKNLETVKKSVQSLVKRGILKKLGSTKSAWYEKL